MSSSFRELLCFASFIRHQPAKYPPSILWSCFFQKAAGCKTPPRLRRCNLVLYNSTRGSPSPPAPKILFCPVLFLPTKSHNRHVRPLTRAFFSFDTTRYDSRPVMDFAAVSLLASYLLPHPPPNCQLLPTLPPVPRPLDLKAMSVNFR